MSIFEHKSALVTEVSARLTIAVKQIEFARRYSKTLLDDLSDDDWFRTPPENLTGKNIDDAYVTHIAWQAGHIAMAQYGLTLFRQRGRDREVDNELMSSKFRKLFMRGTKPEADREKYPAPGEIVEVMDRVHEQTLVEIAGFDGEQLDEPADAPHAAFATRYGALLFAGQHEMIHAGQIGMLRRMMGKQPLR